jgi:hypothetical protein
VLQRPHPPSCYLLHSLRRHCLLGPGFAAAVATLATPTLATAALAASAITTTTCASSTLPCATAALPAALTTALTARAAQLSRVRRSGRAVVLRVWHRNWRCLLRQQLRRVRRQWLHRIRRRCVAML